MQKIYLVTWGWKMGKLMLVIDRLTWICSNFSFVWKAFLDRIIKENKRNYKV